MRTVAEIGERIKNPKSVFGFDAEAISGYLTLEQVRSIKPGFDGKDWGDDPPPLTRELVIEDMRKYMEFAWGKVKDHRGISASRSIEKMEAWVWLLGDDQVLAKMKVADYPNYGAAILKIICEAYGFPVPQEEWVERMARGDSCRPGCDEGCGE